MLLYLNVASRQDTGDRSKTPGCSSSPNKTDMQRELHTRSDLPISVRVPTKENRTTSNHTGHRFTDHVRKRWSDRVDQQSRLKSQTKKRGLSVEEAFALSAQVEYTLPNGDSAYPGADTYIYAPGHREEELVFIVRDNTVVTVTPSRDRATASPNLSACPCCDGVHEFVADCGCVWCNKAVRNIQKQSGGD
jgi:hypothetical protein